MLLLDVYLCKLIVGTVIDLLRSRATLEAEILMLRQQINVLRRGNFDLRRLILGGICRLFPKMYDTLAIVRPDTVIRWHRAGFRLYLRWRSRRRCGRPTVSLEIRRLIREMSIVNPLWGAPRIHGELLKLGIDVGQTSVAKYMARRRGPPSQGWNTFLRNHADGIAAMDLFVVPTISFRLLYALLIMGHDRRQILWFGVTAHPTAEWIANQLTEACGWEQIPRYLIRDRDGAYGVTTALDAGGAHAYSTKATVWKLRWSAVSPRCLWMIASPVRLRSLPSSPRPASRPAALDRSGCERGCVAQAVPR